MNDWLAAGISYGIFLLLADVESVSELAGALAWGLAGVVFVRNFGVLTQKAPTLFGTPGPSSPPASIDIPSPTPGAPQGV